MKVQKRRLWLLFTIALIVSLAMGGRWYHSHTQIYYKVAATLPEEINAAKRESLALTPADLVRSEPVPDGLNARYLYAQLSATNVYPKEDAYLRAIINGKATNADRQKARNFLKQVAPQLSLVEQAAALPDCDFHQKWSLGPNMIIPPEYACMREMARLLAVQAALQSDAGHPEAALHTIQIGARMAHHVSKDPLLLALIVRIALEAIIDRPLERIIKQYADRPGILRLAAQTELTFGETPDIGYALRGEVVMCRIAAEIIREDESPSDINVIYRIPIIGVPHTVVSDAFEARSLSFWRRVFAAINYNSGDPMATYRAFKAVNEAEEARETGKDGKPTPTYEMGGTLCPYFSGAAGKVVVNVAQRHLRRTLLALLVYRQREGQFPANLSLLSPPAPGDPFIGQPLHYRRTERGFLLYSVGVNLADDGGNAMSAKKGDQPPDIVVSYP